jgi:hypothetical protein
LFTVTEGAEPWWIEVDWLGRTYRILCRLQSVGDERRNTKLEAIWLDIRLNEKPGSDTWRDLSYGLAGSLSMSIVERNKLSVEKETSIILFSLIADHTIP